jgi:D-tyrosyl-tRNA(Tyr) deacylase
MRVLIQRVSRSSVTVGGDVVSEIGRGLLVLLGVEREDSSRTADEMADKTAQLRIFPDDEGKMNRSVEEIGGAVLVVSQFTLSARMKKGRRPSFHLAAPPDVAEDLYLRFASRLAQRGITVERGVFQARMDVELVNDGPVTILLESAESRGRS